MTKAKTSVTLFAQTVTAKMCFASMEKNSPLRSVEQAGFEGCYGLSFEEKQAQFCCAGPSVRSSIVTVDVGFLLDAWKMTLLTTSTF